MTSNRELLRKVQMLLAAMNGLVVTRNFFLFSQKERVAHAMIAAIGLSSRPPDGPALPDVIDRVARAVMRETKDICERAVLTDMQCETLMDTSQRGVEAFTKACGMAKMEEIRAGRAESDWDSFLQRVESILPEILNAETTGHLLVAT